MYSGSWYVDMAFGLYGRFAVITGPLPSLALFVAASISSLVAADAAIILVLQLSALASSGLALCCLTCRPCHALFLLNGSCAV